MAQYEFSCPRCGRFEVRMPMGSAPDIRVCPGCAGTASRVYSTLGLNRSPGVVGAFREREDRSGDSPPVVSRLPAGRRRRSPSHPALGRRPRP
ncbi:zinc ribbon domain-containing protein [Actinopolymorpha pittospori]|uniref:FmdB family regulatory protein n=1 Tax=Actinopolymorpha pittospori TaxID=648752 RepID=A0A927RHJ0_9ACTN|nr:zinc ribbon domain-containing protein [Actinopolymorpha pittospori]MBE1605251.1 putative FmdB family regulatory protein [Actinopolymorpha pittospori]